MIPVSGVFLSSVLLPDESINLIIISAMLMVSLGIIIINYRPKLFNQVQKKA
jgi:drug/metabolite transporter (DMT)-like permease